MTFLAVIAMVTAATQTAHSCASCQGQTISPVPISQVFTGLPTIAPKDQFESTADYIRRLEASRSRGPSAALVLDRPWGDRPLSYNADKGVLTFYGGTFGQGGLNFRDVLSFPVGQGDAYGGIGFEVTRTKTSQSSYEATNGFGAKVLVTRVEEAIDAVWERQLKRGESAFVGAKSFKPVAQLSMNPTQAREIIQRGGSAILATPKPPFTQTGSTGVPPKFDRPREVIKNVRALWADVHCVLVYDGSKRVALALEVK